MKKAATLLTLVAVVLCVAFAVRGNAGTDMHGRDGPVHSFGFGLKVAGAWHAVADLGAGPFETLFSFAADGGMMMSNTTRSKGMVNLTTPLGAWKRIGVRTMAATNLILIQDPDGNLLSYEKVVSELTLDGDELSGPVVGYIYAPGQDPLDPDEIPIKILEGSASARRIPVETFLE